jgi:hypothetical protein
LVSDNPILALDAVGPSTPTVQNVLGFWGDVLLEAAKSVGAVGHEDDLLLRLHPLLAKCVDEPRTRLVVHRLDERETASSGIRVPAIAMERDQALARNRLEPGLLSATDIAAIHADEQRSIWQRIIRPGPLVERYARWRRYKLGFVCFGDPEKMSSDPLGANRPVERQDFVEQSDRQTVGHQRGEFGFQKQHLWADALAQQLCQRSREHPVGRLRRR